MALPAVFGLAAMAEVQVHAPPWGTEVYRGLTVFPVDAPANGDVGVLFKPSFGAAWRWRHLSRRVGLATAGRGVLLTDALPVVVEHRRDGYRRLAAQLGATVADRPRYAHRGVAPVLPAKFVGLNPWSPSATVRWPHYRALADGIRARGGHVVWFGGPGEPVAALAGDDPCFIGLSLVDFGAALQGCTLFVSNDSGAAHFAAACGTDVLMLHGSTTAARTGVGVAVEGPALWCRPCYRKWCWNGLKCLERLEVATVLARITDAHLGTAR